ncbi:hypothetical protein BZG00_06740 [Salinivibrio kushneri]|uniref:DUF4880 domain-containing protein n=1 Tax=Salinivibrio kushneri TaxID=1908198 RepID=A0AB36JZW7_9GAMM|nr:DUF4880 domain-containing protein [Salinivibrio kushneri]OOE40013.1 hypothetical protein BZG00_06740 [Salinivibrio kushneri]QCP01026.1 DUF4880 domain-containing protein [Salinivibrio kushneri]
MMSSLSPHVVEQAAQWMARMWADDVSEQDKQALSQWRRAHPHHEKAWQALEGVQSQLQDVSGHHSVLLRQSGLSRRRFLVLGGIGIGAGCLLAWRSNAQRYEQGVALASRVGELKQFTLPDQSRIALNTDSRVWVDYQGGKKQIFLERGEVMLEAASPLSVLTAHGQVWVEDQGQLAVRQFTRFSAIQLLSTNASIQPYQGQLRHIPAGHSVQCTANKVQHLAPLETHAVSWLEQKLVAERMPLSALVEEFSRYFSGWLRLDAQLNDLTVTGVFSTRNIQQTLANLETILPIALRFRTALWVQIIPAQ